MTCKHLIAAPILGLALAGLAQGAGADTLRLLTWGGYAPDNVVEMFEKETGHTVEVTKSNNEEMIAKLRATGGGGFDLAQPSQDRIAGPQAEFGIYKPINLAMIDEAQFIPSMLAATIAMVLELGAWLIGMAWLSAKNVRRLAVFLGIAVFVAVAVGLMAAAGKSYDAGPWTVLASRAVGELTRHPRPFGPEMLRSVVELLELVGAATALASRSRGNVACTALGLALLARSATDIPILALGLCLAALAGPLARVEPKVEPKEGAEGSSAPSTTPQ